MTSAYGVNSTNGMVFRMGQLESVKRPGPGIQVTREIVTDAGKAESLDEEAEHTKFAV